MRNAKEILLEEHPMTDTFGRLYDELAEYCQEALEIKWRIQKLNRSSEEFYTLMARLDTVLMGMGLTAKHLRQEAERMDEMLSE